MLPTDKGRAKKKKQKKTRNCRFTFSILQKNQNQAWELCCFNKGNKDYKDVQNQFILLANMQCENNCPTLPFHPLKFNNWRKPLLSSLIFPSSMQPYTLSTNARRQHYSYDYYYPLQIHIHFLDWCCFILCDFLLLELSYIWLLYHAFYRYYLFILSCCVYAVAILTWKNAPQQIP